MATIEQVVLVCDLCGSESDVLMHTVEIDGDRVDVEVCGRDWGEIRERLAGVLAEGRRVRKARRRRVKVPA